MAAWMATEIFGACGNEVGVTLTPVGKGRFEVYIDDELVYNNKEHEASGITPESVKAINKQIKAKLAAQVAMG